MRLEPRANTSSPPRAAAARGATPSGNRPLAATQAASVLGRLRCGRSNLTAKNSYGGRDVPPGPTDPSARNALRTCRLGGHISIRWHRIIPVARRNQDRILGSHWNPRSSPVYRRALLEVSLLTLPPETGTPALANSSSNRSPARTAVYRLPSASITETAGIKTWCLAAREPPGSLRAIGRRRRAEGGRYRKRCGRRARRDTAAPGEGNQAEPWPEPDTSPKTYAGLPGCRAADTGR